MQEKNGEKQEKFSKEDVLKRVEVLGEAVQTALEALLEIQAEQRLLVYMLAKRREK